MVHITVAYGVEDYEKWKLEFNTHSEARKAAGCLSEAIYVSPDDHNRLNILFEWDSKENFLKWLNNPELKKAIAKLTSSPMIKYWDLQTE